MDLVTSSVARFRKTQSRGVSLRRIGVLSGVSRSTVSLALKDSPRVAAEIRARVQQIARAVGYQPNPYISNAMSIIASQRRRSARRSLAVVVNVRGIPLPLDQIRSAIRSVCEENEATLTEFELKSSESIASVARIIDVRGVTGCLLVGFDRPVSPLCTLAVKPSIAIGNPLAVPWATTLLHDRSEAVHTAIAGLRTHGYRQPAVLAFAAGGEDLAGNDTLYDLNNLGYPRGENPRLVEAVQTWADRTPADVVLGFGQAPAQILVSAGCTLPYVDLEFTVEHPCLAAVVPDGVAIGRSAAELLINATYESQALIPHSRRTILIPGVWQECL